MRMRLKMSGDTRDPWPIPIHALSHNPPPAWSGALIRNMIRYDRLNFRSWWDLLWYSTGITMPSPCWTGSVCIILAHYSSRVEGITVFVNGKIWFIIHTVGASSRWVWDEFTYRRVPYSYHHTGACCAVGSPALTPSKTRWLTFKLALWGRIISYQKNSP